MARPTTLPSIHNPNYVHATLHPEPNPQTLDSYQSKNLELLAAINLSMNQLITELRDNGQKTQFELRELLKNSTSSAQKHNEVLYEGLENFGSKIAETVHTEVTAMCVDLNTIIRVLYSAGQVPTQNTLEWHFISTRRVLYTKEYKVKNGKQCRRRPYMAGAARSLQ